MAIVTAYRPAPDDLVLVSLPGHAQWIFGIVLSINRIRNRCEVRVPITATGGIRRTQDYHDVPWSRLKQLPPDQRNLNHALLLELYHL